MTDGPIASASSRCYQITHRTVYRYSDVVTSSYGRGFLIPRDSARQRCLSHELIMDPDDIPLLSSGFAAEWQVLPDRTLDRGAIRVETASGGVEDGPELWRRAIAEALHQC